MPQLVWVEHNTGRWLLQFRDESFKLWLKLELQREDMIAWQRVAHSCLVLLLPHIALRVVVMKPVQLLF